MILNDQSSEARLWKKNNTNKKDHPNVKIEWAWGEGADIVDAFGNSVDIDENDGSGESHSVRFDENLKVLGGLAPLVVF